jgi:hypothetical protein
MFLLVMALSHRRDKPRLNDEELRLTDEIASLTSKSSANQRRCGEFRRLGFSNILKKIDTHVHIFNYATSSRHVLPNHTPSSHFLHLHASLGRRSLEFLPSLSFLSFLLVGPAVYRLQQCSLLWNIEERTKQAY